MTIDQKINNRMKEVVKRYVYSAYTMRVLYPKFPSNLKYGGHRNTAYDFRNN